MHLIKMEGAWGGMTGWLYERVVGAGAGALYDRFAGEVAAALERGSRVIDVGCGQGQIAARLAERCPTCQVTGFDLSEAMVRRAIRHNPKRDNLTFRQGDAMALPLSDESVDAAVSVASIKHWPDRGQGLRELLRVLRPGGALVVLEAERGCSTDASRRFVSSWRHLAGPISEPFEAWYFQTFVAGQALNGDELLGLLTRVGAADIEVEPVAELPFVVARARKGPPAP